MADRPTVTVADLARLNADASRPEPLLADGVQDYALAALVVLRGLSRADKLKVIRRMRRLMA